MLEQKSLSAFLDAVKKLDAGFAALPAFSAKTPNEKQIAEVLDEIAERLHDVALRSSGSAA